VECGEWLRKSHRSQCSFGYLDERSRNEGLHCLSGRRSLAGIVYKVEWHNGRLPIDNDIDQRRIKSETLCMSEEERLSELQHLKRVSSIKHQILSRYLPGWASILGSRSRTLCYFDCYAGPGRYEREGQAVPGSPSIAVEAASRFSRTHPGHKLVIRLIEADPAQVSRLEGAVGALQPLPSNVDVKIRLGEAVPEVSSILDRVSMLPPSFFLVDPYGHPLPVPVLNRILGHAKSEVLINLMWWRISMDLANPVMTHRIDELFGDRAWQEQPFMALSGAVREREFVEYFKSRMAARYVLEFKIRMDPEDAQSGSRTKYYLLHASNNVRAVLLMKEVMWPLGDEQGTFDFSAESQQVLISSTPRVEELEAILLQRFTGQEVGFDDLRERTWELPFVEKHYREVVHALEQRRVVDVVRLTSKKTGIKGQDRIRFVPRGKQ
jgi:three-Cys-motif partner protein